MITEKAYVLGKFARVAIGHEATSITTAGFAWSRPARPTSSPSGSTARRIPGPIMPKAKVVLIAARTSAECAPITTDYLWQCSENGGKLIVVDPRMTPITRNADLYSAGAARHGSRAASSAMLHVIVRDGLTNAEYIEKHTTGIGMRSRSVRAWIRRPGRGDDRRAAGQHREGRALDRPRQTVRWGFMRAGIEHHSKGVENCLAMINLFLATGNFGREGAGCMMITGQGNGQGGREHGQKCDQLPGQRARLPIRKLADMSRGVWGIDEKELPGAGLDSAVEIMEAIHGAR